MDFDIDFYWIWGFMAVESKEISNFVGSKNAVRPRAVLFGVK